VAVREQHNFRARYEQETVPCEGEVGDILILTPLAERDFDRELQGSASVWFCIKKQLEGQPAVWARVQFDGVASCGLPVPTPPQDHPLLTKG
jgi:hypothetical protein